MVSAQPYFWIGFANCSKTRTRCSSSFVNDHHSSPDLRNPLETAAYNEETLVRKMKKSSQKASPVSTSQKVENFIRSAIYEGRLKPRERIIEDDIARQLG